MRPNVVLTLWLFGDCAVQTRIGIHKLDLKLTWPGQFDIGVDGIFLVFTEPYTGIVHVVRLLCWISLRCIGRVVVLRTRVELKGECHTNKSF